MTVHKFRPKETPRAVADLVLSTRVPGRTIDQAVHYWYGFANGCAFGATAVSLGAIIWAVLAASAPK